MGFYKNAGGAELVVKDNADLNGLVIPVGKIIIIEDKILNCIVRLECCKGENCVNCFFHHTFQYNCPRCMDQERKDGTGVWFREL